MSFSNAKEKLILYASLIFYPIPTLAIEQQRWNSVLSRTNHAPNEVDTYVYRLKSNTRFAGSSERYKFMTLPLHQACMRNPPSIIVSALISASPSVASIKCDGNLPLHLALKYGAGFHVIQVLILAYPQGLKVMNSERKTPITIFNENQSKWESQEMRDSIQNVLKGGVDTVDLTSQRNLNDLSDKAPPEETTKSTEQESSQEIKQDLATAFNEEGWKKVRYDEFFINGVLLLLIWVGLIFCISTLEKVWTRHCDCWSIRRPCQEENLSILTSTF